MLIDPAVAFGRPTVKGIRADVLRSRFESGEDVAMIAEDFGLQKEEVEQAIRFDEIAAAGSCRPPSRLPSSSPERYSL